jgi:hypothetical protein
MGNAAPKPHHTPDESTMVFDTHLCTPQGAHRVYGINQHPAVCTINEYADIFGLATEALNFPTVCCCSVGHGPQQAALLQRLHAQYPHLGMALRQVHYGGRLILVLVLTRPQHQQHPQEVAATVVLPGHRQDQEVASSSSMGVSPMRLAQPLPPPIPPPLTIPMVQAIPMQDRK